MWRVPFILSFIFFLIYIKLNPEFKKDHSSNDTHEKFSLKIIFKQMPKQLLTMIALSAGQTAIYYLIFTYLITYFQVHQQMSKDNAFLIINVLFFISIFLFPLFGLIADNQKNKIPTIKKICLIFFIGILIFSFAKLNIVIGIIGAGILAIAFCGIISYTTSYFAEIFPVKYRMSACSISFNLGVSISGFAPMIAEILLKISTLGLSGYLLINLLIIYISVSKINHYLPKS